MHTLTLRSDGYDLVTVEYPRPQRGMRSILDALISAAMWQRRNGVPAAHPRYVEWDGTDLHETVIILDEVTGTTDAEGHVRLLNAAIHRRRGRVGVGVLTALRDALMDAPTCAQCGALLVEHPDEGNGPYWTDLDGDPCMDPETTLPAPHGMVAA